MLSDVIRSSLKDWIDEGLCAEGIAIMGRVLGAQRDFEVREALMGAPRGWSSTVAPPPDVQMPPQDESSAMEEREL